MDQYAQTRQRCAPWNKGKLIGQKSPLRLSEIWAIRIRLQVARKTRDLALFNLGIDRKLRGCDLVALRVCDVAQRRTRRCTRHRHAAENWPTRAVRADAADA
jgi:hypothetical protein